MSRAKANHSKNSNMKSKQHPRRNATADMNGGKWNLNEPVTMSIMQEMGVLPLDDTPNMEDQKTSVLVSLNHNRPSKMMKLGKSSATDTASLGYKAFPEDFVFFRKSSGHSKIVGPNQFQKLSDETILDIFKWLPKPVLAKCAEVSKRWKTLSYDDTLWRRYDFGRKHLKSGVLGELLPRGVIVLRLAMSEIKSPCIDGELKMKNGSKFCRLQYLDLSVATISEDCLAQLLSLCNRLRKLSIEHCKINDDCCRYIGQNTNLEVLNAAMCSGFSTSGLVDIASGCTRLIELNLSWTDMTPSDMDAFIKIVPFTLSRLNISGHRQCFSDAHAETIATRCRNLTELDFSDSPLLTFTAIQKLIAHCPNLEHLHSSRCYTITPTAYLSLQKLSGFCNLEVFGILNAESLKFFRDSMPGVAINQTIFSTIARPTVGIRRTSVWGLRVRD